MSYRLTQQYGNYTIIDATTQQPFLTIGPHDFDRQWGEWYTMMLCRVETPGWPIPGLRVHAAFDSEKPSWLFTWNGLPTGTVGWNGLEWWWYMMDHWGNQFGSPDHIEVDATTRLKFQDERLKVASHPETVRDVMAAEMEGRIRLYRDETAEMALIYGKVQARKRGLGYDAAGVDHTCTGYTDEGGTVCHDANTCPVHEA